MSIWLQDLDVTVNEMFAQNYQYHRVSGVTNEQFYEAQAHFRAKGNEIVYRGGLYRNSVTFDIER